MDDPLGRDELALIQRLRSHVELGVGRRDPEGVVETVAKPLRGQLRAGPRRPVLGMAAVLVIGVAGLAGLALVAVQPSSRAATAEVAGRTYTLSVVRSIALPRDVLTPHAPIDRIEGGFPLVNSTAYSIRGIDPAKVLVVVLRPGQRDDAGPIGSYLALVRGSDAVLCPYFATGDPLAPRDCP